MRDAILRKARESAETKLRFFDENAELLERCGHKGQASTAALMILAVMNQQRGIDQMELPKRLKHCEAAGMTEQEFYVGCGELNALELLRFVRSAHSGFVVAKMNESVETSEWIDASEAMAALARYAA